MAGGLQGLLEVWNSLQFFVQLKNSTSTETPIKSQGGILRFLISWLSSLFQAVNRWD